MLQVGDQEGVGATTHAMLQGQLILVLLLAQAQGQPAIARHILWDILFALLGRGCHHNSDHTHSMADPVTHRTMGG